MQLNCPISKALSKCTNKASFCCYHVNPVSIILSYINVSIADDRMRWNCSWLFYVVRFTDRWLKCRLQCTIIMMQHSHYQLRSTRVAYWQFVKNYRPLDWCIVIAMITALVHQCRTITCTMISSDLSWLHEQAPDTQRDYYVLHVVEMLIQGTTLALDDQPLPASVLYVLQTGRHMP